MSNNRVLVYIRTSTDDKQDASPDVQMAKIQAYCNQNGLDIVARYDDYLSGATELEKRPGLSRLVSHARREGIRQVIVLRMDRAFRELEVMLSVTKVLGKFNCKIVGIDDPVQDDGSASSTMLRNILTAAAQYQREMTGQMVKDKQLFKVQNGIPQGGDPPFGYKSVKGLYQIGAAYYNGWVPDDTEIAGRTLANWYLWIVGQFRSHGNASEIARQLTDLGVPTPRLVLWNRMDNQKRAKRMEVHQRRAESGLKVMQYPPSPIWDASVLSDMLRSHAYLGRIQYNGQWFPGRHEAIIDESVFNDVQTILNSRGSRRQPIKREDVLLSGMLLCQGCGRKMTRVEKNQYQRRYVCNLGKNSNGKFCNNKRYNAFAIDAAAYGLLVSGMKRRREELLDNQLLMALQDPVANDHSADIARLTIEKERLLYQHQKRFINDFELERRMVQIQGELEQYEKKMKPEVVESKLEELERVIDHLDQVWPLFPMELKREILRTYVPGGYRLNDMILEAEVCGIPLQAPIETGDDFRKKRQSRTGPQGPEPSAYGQKKTHTNKNDFSFSQYGSRSERRDSYTQKDPQWYHPLLVPQETGRHRVLLEITEKKNGPQLEALQAVNHTLPC